MIKCIYNKNNLYIKYIIYKHFLIVYKMFICFINFIFFFFANCNNLKKKIIQDLFKVLCCNIYFIVIYYTKNE